MQDPAIPASSTQPSPAAPVGAAGPALRAGDVSKSYGVVKALQPATLELAAGEVHALVGENGLGKSTFVGIVSGTVTPDTGTVEIGGKLCRKHTLWESIRHGALTTPPQCSVIAVLS